jgi:hypothetical protein
MLNCQNSGYTDPHNCKRCRCPSGLGGKNCGKPKKTKTDCGSATIRQASTTMKQLEFGGQFVSFEKFLITGLFSFAIIFLVWKDFFSFHFFRFKNLNFHRFREFLQLKKTNFST